MQFTSQELTLAPVNVVPLINVVFLLLIFFLLAGGGSDILDSMIPIDLPKAEASQEPAREPVVIVIGPFEDVLVNDQLVPADALADYLTELYEDFPSRRITLKVDAHESSTRLLTVLEQANRSGAESVSLMTQAF